MRPLPELTPHVKTANHLYVFSVEMLEEFYLYFMRPAELENK